MILTPTYHVYDMYSVHQGAELVDSWIETKEIGIDGFHTPNLHESASIAEDGTLNATICNLSPTESAHICADVLGNGYRLKEAFIVGGDMGDFNTFDQPDKVQVQPFTGCKLAEGRMMDIQVPASSVVRISLEPLGIAGK